MRIVMCTQKDSEKVKLLLEKFGFILKDVARECDCDVGDLKKVLYAMNHTGKKYSYVLAD